jgi:CheY-like chemotaxis protein
MHVLATMTPEPTLLVIDDEPGVVATVDRFAHGFGVTVISRSDARAAVAELPVLKPDVVMVDLRMPDLTGLDVLHAAARHAGSFERHGW